jgi:SAM-dependent methyltransferase
MTVTPTSGPWACGVGLRARSSSIGWHPRRVCGGLISVVAVGRSRSYSSSAGRPKKCTLLIRPKASLLSRAPGAHVAKFQQGEAMALPFTDASFDAAVMALVLFFVPDPAKGVAEMARVVRPGGLVAAYLWDFAAGGFPFHPIQVEMRAMGLTPLLPPSVQASRMDVLLDLWAGAGFKNVESRVITVTRSFASFEEFWTISTNGTGMRPIIEAMAPADTELLKSRVKVRLPADAEGRITYQGTANAIKGRVPA